MGSEVGHETTNICARLYAQTACFHCQHIDGLIYSSMGRTAYRQTGVKGAWERRGTDPGTQVRIMACLDRQDGCCRREQVRVVGQREGAAQVGADADCGDHVGKVDERLDPSVSILSIFRSRVRGCRFLVAMSGDGRTFGSVYGKS